MLKGVYLTLMVGPVVPIPVPQVVLDALTGVEVMVNDTGASGFQLTFTLSNDSPLHTLFLLAGSNPIPFMRVIIIATLNGIPNVLMDGVITNQQVAPGGDASHSTLTVTGEDLSALMNQQEFSGLPFPAMPAEARVALTLVKYAFLGIIPLVIPSILLDVPIPTEEIPTQQGTDLAYIRQLADNVGYVFYIDPGPVPGTSIAYWGPQVKVGIPQPALNINMDAFTNVETLTFNFDSQSRTLPVVLIQNAETKIPIPIPIPDISPLNPPLGLIPPLPNKIEFLNDTAKLNPIRAALEGLRRASKSTDAVTGSGSLDVIHYGRILKARQLVGVRGAGLAFDGLYYVNSVTHSIKRGEYKQSFKLSRNGLVSIVPQVIP
jgi:hypothetical protein